MRKVKRNAQFAEYFFSGWKDHTTAAGELSGTDTLAQGFGQAVLDKKNITSGETFNPGTGQWRVAARIKPYLVTVAGQAGKHLPAPSSCTTGCGAANPSYNLVQKGRNGTSVPGGFYKVEIMGHPGSIGGLSYLKGSVHCQFRDSDGTSVDAFTGVAGTGQNVIIDSVGYYKIDCLRSGGNVTLTVRQEKGALTQVVAGATTSAGSTAGLGTVSPENGAGATAFSPLFGMGKKPDSTHIEDSFAGWADYLVLATS